MTTQEILAPIGDAFYADSYDWLVRNHLSVAVRIESAVKAGASPEQIFRYALSELGAEREALAIRCKQAAQHLASRN